VFEELWHAIPDAELGPARVAAWGDIRNLREMVSKRIEEKRARKELGSSLQAELEIQAHGSMFESLKSLEDDLKFAFIVSQVSVSEAKGAPLQVVVKASEHVKCERCWHYRADVNPEGLCARCDSNLHGAGEPRRHA